MEREVAMFKFTLRFPNTSLADEDYLAERFSSEVSNFSKNVKLNRIKSSTSTQDLGALVEIVVGSASLIEFVRTLYSWMRRRNVYEVVLKDGDRCVLIKVESLEEMIDIICFFLENQ